ncbi:MAG: hypothetical protein U0573_09660 [Phycisphaerales bacterium]|nr:hypothetical protein [Planctomycetota bacterium]
MIHLSHCLSAAALCSMTVGALADFNAYENSRHTLAGANKPGAVATFNSEWVGQALYLSPATPSLTITGVDAAFSLFGTSPIAAGNYRLRIRIYGGFQSAGSPVFSSLFPSRPFSRTIRPRSA